MKFRKTIKSLVKGRGRRSKDSTEAGKISPYQQTSSTGNSSGSTQQQPIQLLHSNPPESPLHNAQPVVPQQPPARFEDGHLLGSFSDEDEAHKRERSDTLRDSGFADSAANPELTPGAFGEHMERRFTPIQEPDSPAMSTEGEALDLVPSIFPLPDSSASRPSEDRTLAYMQERAVSRDGTISSEPQLTRGNSIASRSSISTISSNYDRSWSECDSTSLKSYIEKFTAAEYQKMLPRPQSFLRDELSLSDPSASVEHTLSTSHPAVHEWIHPQTTDKREEVISREIHTHEVFHSEQPIIQREFLPTKHLLQRPDGTLVPAVAKDDGTWAIGAS